MGVAGREIYPEENVERATIQMARINGCLERSDDQHILKKPGPSIKPNTVHPLQYGNSNSSLVYNKLE